MSPIRLDIDGHAYTADPARPASLAIPLLFNGPQPGFFAAPAASGEAFESTEFHGHTRTGGSCNVASLHLTPHCNGTHTECVGHVTDDGVAVTDQLPGGWFPATLVTLEPRHDVLDAALVEAGLQRYPVSGMHAAFILRTLPNGSDKLSRNYSLVPAPHIAETAIKVLVAAGVQHLLVDLPSLDPVHDHGRLAAHRGFWGLPAGSRRRADARRPQATVTELIYVPNAIPDGYYLLDLQIPAFMSDAAPSRPIVYPLEPT
ncbi:MAG: cyclase family protein [Gammaproteobacteria bacterium]